MKDLSRLSLVNPHYISVDENAKYSTPSGLVQSYIICDLDAKMNFLWSFIKNHRTHKSLIFLSSCKQVRKIMKIVQSSYRFSLINVDNLGEVRVRNFL